MKTETILKKVNEYLSDMDKNKILQLKQDLEEEIRKESVKAKGLKMDSAIKKVLKNISNTNLIFGCYPYKNNRAFTDGFRVYVVNDDYGYPKNEELEEPSGINISRIIPQTDIYTQEIKVDISDLEAYTKIVKAEKKLKNNPYILQTDHITHNNKPWQIGFNAEYLLDMLKAYKTDTIYCTTSNVSPCLTSLDLDGEFGLLLPVRIKEEENV